LKNQLFFCHYSMNVDRKENAPAWTLYVNGK
jgi:hypothetical protein